ncbi:hypothetical protein [Aquamicrobium defluvii]|nr:hypothetical protein [Aquamicrobium defluvii]
MSTFNVQTLRDLPDIDALEDAGLLSRKGVQEKAMTAFEDESTDQIC